MAIREGQRLFIERLKHGQMKRRKPKAILDNYLGNLFVVAASCSLRICIFLDKMAIGFVCRGL